MALLTELCSFGNASPYHIDSVTNLRQPNRPLYRGRLHCRDNISAMPSRPRPLGFSMLA